MLIRKGNPEGLLCWRTIDGYAPGNGLACQAEKCVAFEPNAKQETQQVTEEEEDALLAKGEGWERFSITLYRPEGSKRVTMVRMIDDGTGQCGALPLEPSSSD